MAGRSGMCQRRRSSLPTVPAAGRTELRRWVEESDSEEIVIEGFSIAAVLGKHGEFRSGMDSTHR